MSQRPDTHASVNGICANSLNALSTDGERHGAVLAFTMATLFTVGLLVWLCTVPRHPAVRATALKASSFELADALTKITWEGLPGGGCATVQIFRSGFLKQDSPGTSS
jgi:hypothetical protein